MKKITIVLLGVLISSVLGFFYLSYLLRLGGPEFVQELTPEEKKVCAFTGEVTEGPYYISGSPKLVDGNLNYHNFAGDRLKITGHVYEGLDNSKPLKNAKIEFWQTDAKGEYHPNANGNISKYSEDEIGLRGYVETDENGKYVLKTIYPGEYTGRARHIHVKVFADGFKELTSQLLLALPGDKIEFDEDTISRGLPNCQLLSSKSSGQTDKPKEVYFDFRLKK